MRYPHTIIGFTLLQLLAATGSLQAATTVGADNPASLSMQQMSRVEMAAYLLEHHPHSPNELAIEQARELVAGRAGKGWKNCILEKEVSQSLQHRLHPGITPATAVQ